MFSLYLACSFELNGLKVKHRMGKITPTKTGQFVTIWKRNEQGITTPFDALDEFDLLIISVKNVDHFGQFIFPKAVLIKHKIISYNNVEGKRGMRVYPLWDATANKQAEKTQQWNVQYFLPISGNGTPNLLLAKRLMEGYP